MPYFRDILSTLYSEDHSRQIVFLLGARQVGKTTLLQMIQERMKTAGYPTLYIDLDLARNVDLMTRLEDLLGLLKEHGYRKTGNRFYLFLDEVQRFGEASLILKNLYDHYSNVKVYASGSSTLEIKHKIKDSLAGRKYIHTVYPLTFDEFLFFKNEGERGAGVRFDCLQYKDLLDEYLRFGGYPAVVLADGAKQKLRILDSIFDLFVKKDILEFLHIENVSALKTVLELLAVHHGRIFQYNTIARDAMIDVRTLKNYLHILEETFLVFTLRPFFTNRKKEVVKSPKIYFFDSGVRNYFARSIPEDLSLSFEQAVIGNMMMRKNLFDSVLYWRDKNQNEVDAVIRRQGRILPVEVKYKKHLSLEDTRGLRSFMKQYGVSDSYVVNVVENKDVVSDVGTIHFITRISYEKTA